MELVTEKYKQTEVGLIPSDWEVKKLGEYSFITKLAGFEYTLHFNSYKDEGDIIVVRGTNITHNKLDLTDVRTIPRSTSNFLQRSKLYKNDLVFAYVGTIGPIFLVEEDDRFHLGPNTAKITVNKELNSMFLFHYFTSSFLKKEITEHTSVGAQPSLSMSKIRSFRIILPSTKAEQTAIATALSDADALISSLEKLIAKKRNIKQGAMQQLLQPKEGWEVKKLGDLFKLSASNSKSGYLTDEGKYIVMDMGAVSSEGTILKSKRTNLNSDILNYGDLVMPKDDIGGGNIIGKVGYIDKTDSYVLGDHVYKLELITSKIDSLYFYFLINSVYINKHFRAKASGSAQLGLGRKSVLEQELIYPCTKDEQTHIATILSDMDAEIQALETKLEKYRKIKLGMMQNLLTGKIRLV